MLLARRAFRQRAGCGLTALLFSAPSCAHSVAAPLTAALLPSPPAWQVLKDIPLYVVTEEKIGLLGTREQAIRIAQDVVLEKTIAT